MSSAFFYRMRPKIRILLPIHVFLSIPSLFFQFRIVLLFQDSSYLLYASNILQVSRNTFLCPCFRWMELLSGLRITIYSRLFTGKGAAETIHKSFLITDKYGNHSTCTNQGLLLSTLSLASLAAMWIYLIERAPTNHSRPSTLRGRIHIDTISLAQTRDCYTELYLQDLLQLCGFISDWNYLNQSHPLKHPVLCNTKGTFKDRNHSTAMANTRNYYK